MVLLIILRARIGRKTGFLCIFRTLRFGYPLVHPTQHREKKLLELPPGTRVPCHHIFSKWNGKYRTRWHDMQRRSLSLRAPCPGSLYFWNSWSIHGRFQTHGKYLEEIQTTPHPCTLAGSHVKTCLVSIAAEGLPIGWSVSTHAQSKVKVEGGDHGLKCPKSQEDLAVSNIQEAIKGFHQVWAALAARWFYSSTWGCLSIDAAKKKRTYWPWPVWVVICLRHWPLSILCFWRR